MTTMPAETDTAACCGTDCCADEPTAAENAAIKATVRERYAEIATEGGSCCGSDCGCGFSMIGDEYEAVEGYVAEADLGLGCGLPTEHAGLRAGQTVLDLGSGAGLDAFVAREIVGESGRVIGVDMTPEMVARARENAVRLGVANVEFLQGEIEALPLEDASVDVILSNCVLNLVPDKAAAFAEMARVLRPGGHFCISDVVIEGTLPDVLRRSAELLVGCVAGAMERGAYLDALRAAGFAEVRVVAEKTVGLPEAVGRLAGAVVQSVTVVGVRPA